MESDTTLPESWWHVSASAPSFFQYPAALSSTPYDVAIIGAGFTGLNAALTLAQQGLSVLVIDQALPGWGASGRNGGFCCIGGDHLGIAAIAHKYGNEQALNYAHYQLDAIDGVRQFLTHNKVEADLNPCGELVLAHHPRAMPLLDDYAQSLQHWYGLKAQPLSREQLTNRGLHGNHHGGLQVPAGFSLHPLKYLYGLCERAQQAGVAFALGAPVAQVNASPASWHLQRTNAEPVQAHKLLIATNGYTADSLHPALSGRILAAQSNILVTRPLSRSELQAQGWTSQQACYDTRNLLYYFRLLPDNRFLFGGRAGISDSATSFAARRQQHRADFGRYFPAWANVDVDYFWRGHVAMSRRLTPHVAQLDQNLWCALAYHGNGIAMGSACGRSAAKLIMGLSDENLPAFMQQAPARFPLAALRPAYLAMTYAWYGLKDGRL